MPATSAARTGLPRTRLAGSAERAWRSDTASPPGRAHTDAHGTPRGEHGQRRGEVEVRRDGELDHIAGDPRQRVRQRRR